MNKSGDSRGWLLRSKCCTSSGNFSLKTLKYNVSKHSIDVELEVSSFTVSRGTFFGSYYMY